MSVCEATTRGRTGTGGCVTSYSVLTASPPFTVDDSQDVFGEGSQLYMHRPQQTPAGTPRRRPAEMPEMPTAVTMPVAAPPMPPMPTTATPPQMEEIELMTPRANQLAHNP